MAKRFYVQAFLLFLLALSGCLGTEPATKGNLIINEEDDGSSYTPPTPIFRDIRIVLSADHLAAELSEGNSLDTFALNLSGITLSSTESDEKLTLLEDQDRPLDLTAEEPAEIISIRLFQGSPYKEITLTFDSVTIGGSFMSLGQTYTFEFNSAEPIETVAIIPEEILALTTSSNLQTLISSESLEFDLNITLPTLETYQEVVSIISEDVVLYNISPGETIQGGEGTSDSRTQSIKEIIRNRLKGLKNSQAVPKTKNKENEEAPPDETDVKSSDTETAATNTGSGEKDGSSDENKGQSQDDRKATAGSEQENSDQKKEEVDKEDQGQNGKAEEGDHKDKDGDKNKNKNKKKK